MSDGFDELTQDFEPDWVDQMWRERPDDMRRAAIRYQEAVATGSHEQIRRNLAWLIDALTGAVLIATFCGVITWIGWVMHWWHP